jgi:hypothetical protein
MSLAQRFETSRLATLLQIALVAVLLTSSPGSARHQHGHHRLPLASFILHKNVANFTAALRRDLGVLADRGDVPPLCPGWGPHPHTPLGE